MIFSNLKCKIFEWGLIKSIWLSALAKNSIPGGEASQWKNLVTIETAACFWWEP